MPRLVYSLLFEACPGIRPVGKPRVVDLRPGDSFVFAPTQKTYKLTAMTAYRQHHFDDEEQARSLQPKEGYFVPR